MLGINPARLEFFNLSAAMGPRWAEICTEFSEKITALGPSPIWFALQKKKASTETEKEVV
jgi:F420-non-reducing hydrogenase iron-sulfur subunit